jgi:tetratricopeptide (TPR) repeat protein
MHPMATDPAPPRRLWQFPTFLLGIAALWAMWTYGHRLRPSVADRFDRAVSALRPPLDRWPPDIDLVQAALRKLPEGDPPADKANAVHYLVGSAYVALAEAAGSDADAAESWVLAKTHLEAVTVKDMPVNDQKKLKYRLARVWYHTPGTDRKKVIEALTQSAQGGDDPSEGFQLLAKLYHDEPTRDEARERDALRNYLKHVTQRANARTLNEARVRLAELHARLGEGEEARRVLERVGPEAPPEVYAAARLQLASFQRIDQDWAAAEKVLKQVREMNGATDKQRTEARVQLAEVYVKLGRPRDAEADLNDGKMDGPEGPAIMFQRAKLGLRDPNVPRDLPIRDLEQAFAGDAEAARKLISAAEATQVCTAAYEKAKAAGDFGLAVRAAAVLGKVGDGGAELRLVADAQAAWAVAAAGDEGKDHFRAAAAACETAAKGETTPAGKGDWLRQAAGFYLKAGDRAKGLAVLGDLTTRLPDYPEDKAGQAWAEMGDVYLAAGDRDQARLAFQNAASRPGPAQDHARVKFASLAHDAGPGKPNPAATMLEEIVARPDGGDKTAREEATFLLGEVYLLQKDWAKAGDKLRGALAVYPDSPRIPRAHYQLGQVLRHAAYEAAAQIKSGRAELDAIKKERLANRQPAWKIDEQLKIEDRIERSEKTFQTQMRSAFEEFKKAEETFPTSSDADPDAVRRTGFWAADCAFWLGDYADGVTRCEKLRAKYQGHVEELEAGRDLYRCCVYAAIAAKDAKDTDGSAAWSKRAADTRSQVQTALARVPAAEFDGTAETRSRTYWEGWLAETGRR